MKIRPRFLPVALLAAMAMNVIAAGGLRNPFWPKGYVGEMTPISAEVRPKPKPKPQPKPKAQVPKVDPKAAAAKAAAEKAAREKAAKEAAEKAAREAAAREAAEKKAAAEKAAKEAAARAEAERKREINSEDWKKAMKALKIGNPAVFKAEDGTTRSTISINGNIYGEGDLMSVTHEGIRFTWRVKGLAGGEKLKLERMKARRVNDSKKK